ncbi:hypothetical protein [Abyssicoccus albus]|uniref:Uncharacterized protein n=1 Tax=Abyssicoccus albus TaxID=1817405 RepID=A0A1Q1G3R8_9BACL|nr:hypothetical protein [Abyssicoccus albus]AQL56987.1 hypothetical protein BVH56_08755 [Abyssicoccus albus]RPF56762.1 hypothetical protein EDD62_1422 [Abyssicoccus albus]
MDKKEELLRDIKSLISNVLSDVAYQSSHLNGEYHIKFNLPGGMEFTKVVSENEYLKLVNENILLQIRSTLERLEI